MKAAPRSTALYKPCHKARLLQSTRPLDGSPAFHPLPSHFQDEQAEAQRGAPSHRPSSLTPCPCDLAPLQGWLRGLTGAPGATAPTPTCHRRLHEGAAQFLWLKIRAHQRPASGLRDQLVRQRAHCRHLTVTTTTQASTRHSSLLFYKRGTKAHLFNNSPEGPIEMKTQPPQGRNNFLGPLWT